jgi:hypothetical protein
MSTSWTSANSIKAQKSLLVVAAQPPRAKIALAVITPTIGGGVGIRGAAPNFLIQFINIKNVVYSLVECGEGGCVLPVKPLDFNAFLSSCFYLPHRRFDLAPVPCRRREEKSIYKNIRKYLSHHSSSE